MSESKKVLGVGDVVNVYFSCADALFGVTIVHRPQDTGDSWGLVLNGLRHNVQQFELMSEVDITLIKDNKE